MGLISSNVRIGDFVQLNQMCQYSFYLLSLFSSSFLVVFAFIHLNTSNTSY